MRSREEVVKYEVTVNEKNGKVLVEVEMLPKMGREPTIRVRSSHVRDHLQSQGVDVGVLISGQAVHNNMDRRLGIRTEDDLRSNFVFALGAEAVEVEEPAVEEATPAAEVVEEEVVVKAVKAAPKRRSRAKKKVD